MRAALAVALFLTASMQAVAQPPAPTAEPDKLVWLGRVKPAANYDYGDYKAVKGTDGETRYFPRLAKNVDLAKLAAALPATCDWSAKAPSVLKRMYLNDRYGICVLSSRYHQIGFMTASDTGTGLEADDSECYAAYQAACGRGDNGCNMSAVNQYQQRVGLKVKGVVHKTRGSASVDHTNKELVKGAIYYGGGVNIGMSLPAAWYQSNDGSVWDATGSNIVGGHEVQGYGYNATGVLISTWGGTRTITWAAFLSPRWIDEVYVTLSPDWYGSDSLAPNGVDVAGLEAAFAAIAGGTVPPLPDPVPVPPIPPIPPGPGPAPVPGKGFTGNIVTTQAYKDGVAVGPPVVSLGGGAGAADGLEAELKEAGVSPVLIADVLKLLADVKRKAGKDVILADIMKIILDLGGLAGPVADTPPPCCGAVVPVSELYRRDLYAPEWAVAV